MKTEIRKITPEWAAQILETMNGHNRPMNQAWVNTLTREIKEGRWKFNGDTIRLSETRLIDGQHRLAAVVKSGVTVMSLVIEGLPDDVFDTIDTGKRRSAGDTLSVNGVTNAHRVAAMLVLVDKYMTGQSTKQIQYTNAQVELLLAKYPDAKSAIVSANKGRRLMPPAVMDACNYLFRKVSEELTAEFIEKILKGSDLDSESPWYLLRERLVTNSLSKAKLTKCYIMALCIKAFNAANNGTVLKVLKWSEGEPFPVIRN